MRFGFRINRSGLNLINASIYSQGPNVDALQQNVAIAAPEVAHAPTSDEVNTTSDELNTAPNDVNAASDVGAEDVDAEDVHFKVNIGSLLDVKNKQGVTIGWY